tara:strand:+ start:290 stop:952 length:663 start_codon:yes stop_codon:yes gene_type:complete
VSSGPIGIFGGTFNPVHYGHLRSALEIRERLGLAEVRLMPSARPPHRATPDCSIAERLEMVRLAVAGEPGLVCDERETLRAGPSYTVDSIRELRQEVGPQTSLCLVMGADALLGLADWHQWQQLTDYAHLVVIARPGWHFPSAGAVADWLQPLLCAQVDELLAQPAGKVHLLQLRPLEISSTEIRELIAAGRSPRYLLPDPVWSRIRSAGLYGYNQAAQT